MFLKHFLQKHKQCTCPSNHSSINELSLISDKNVISKIKSQNQKLK